MRYPAVLPGLREDPALHTLPPRASAAFAAACARAVWHIYAGKDAGNCSARGIVCAAITLAERFAAGEHLESQAITKAADDAEEVADAIERAESNAVQHTPYYADRSAVSAAMAAAWAARSILSHAHCSAALEAAAEALGEADSRDSPAAPQAIIIEDAYRRIQSKLAGNLTDDTEYTSQSLLPLVHRDVETHVRLASICSLDDVVARRTQLMRIACTSGFFDPIHPGHIRLLMAAKQYADTLVVLVSDDNALRRKRTRTVGGQVVEGRPFMSHDVRCGIVAAIKGVDYVVKYQNEPDGNVCAALRSLWPACFLKGGDRLDRASIPEWSLCQELGIRVVIPEDCRIKPSEECSQNHLGEWRNRAIRSAIAVLESQLQTG